MGNILAGYCPDCGVSRIPPFLKRCSRCCDTEEKQNDQARICEENKEFYMTTQPDNEIIDCAPTNWQMLMGLLIVIGSMCVFMGYQEGARKAEEQHNVERYCATAHPIESLCKGSL